MTFIFYLIAFIITLYVIVTLFSASLMCILTPINWLLNINESSYGTGHDNKHRFPQSQSEKDEYWARNEAFKAKHNL
jgi:hypothetical protein